MSLPNEKAPFELSLARIILILLAFVLAYVLLDKFLFTPTQNEANALTLSIDKLPSDDLSHMQMSMLQNEQQRLSQQLKVISDSLLQLEPRFNRKAQEVYFTAFRTTVSKYNLKLIYERPASLDELSKRVEIPSKLQPVAFEFLVVGSFGDVRKFLIELQTKSVFPIYVLDPQLFLIDKPMIPSQNVGFSFKILSAYMKDLKK